MSHNIVRSVRVVTPPAFEPVTLAEAKLWCRVDEDDTDQDATLMLLIIAMREYAEHLTGRVFAERTLELRLDSFPADGEIVLPYPPVQSVSAISYIDSDSAETALDASPAAWQEDLTSVPARVKSLSTGTWPTALETYGAVRIQYVAGYATHNLIPKTLRLWMQARISSLFENREQLVTGTIVAELPRAFVDGLLDNLRAERMFA
jgi:uncharacterized phiE125 gp8 family phage protein